MTVLIIANSSFNRYPMTSNSSALYVSLGLVEVGTRLAMALWCFRNVFGGRKLWKGDFLES